MKKYILVLSCLFFFSTLGSAQIGVKAGVNLATQDYGGKQLFGFKPSSILGYVVGLNYKASVCSSLALRPGMEFSTKGSKEDRNGAISSINLSYLELPVDIMYNLSNFSFYTGPYVAFLLSDDRRSFSLSKEAESLDFGVNFGAEFTLGKIGIGAKYGLGLVDINANPFDSLYVKNRVGNVYIIYIL